MRFALELATPADAHEIAAVRSAAAADLKARYGDGPWAASTDTAAAVAIEVTAAETYVVRLTGTVIATLRLRSSSPWIGETKFFTPAEKPLHLTTMAVGPQWQRRGVGRSAVTHACQIASQLGADAIRLDCFDAPAGAGGFYERCGFRQIARTRYLGVPLLWFERVA